MSNVDRIISGLFVLGVWVLVVQQSITSTVAQETDPGVIPESRAAQSIHVTEIVGLSAFVQQAVRDHQFRPQTMPGLDQYIRSVVRNCRVNGVISGGRLSATSLSC